MNSTRKSNIELLRIIAMLLIMAGHYNGQGGVIANVDPNSVNEWFLFVFGFGQKLGVNIFLMIGCYFMVDSEFKSIRLLKIHNQVLFLTLPITFILFTLGFNVTVKNMIQSCLPVIGKPLWFASAYIILITLSPFLKKAFLLEQKMQRNIVVILFFVLSIMPMFSRETDTFLESIFWFSFVYLFMGYAKHFKSEISISSNKVLVLSFGAFVLLGLLKGLSQNILDSGTISNILLNISNRCLHDIKSVPNFIISLGVFYGFLGLKLKSKLINWLAAGSFSVYIVHQTPALYPVLWNNILCGAKYVNENYFIFLFLVQIFAVYTVITLFDVVRRLATDRLLSTLVSQKLQSCIDTVFRE